MAAPLNPTASEHLPMFITVPGETDVLMVIMAVVLGVSVLMFGIFFVMPCKVKAVGQPGTEFSQILPVGGHA